DVPTLRRWLGERAADWLWDRAHGVSDSEVEGHGEAKSISRDETFPRDINDDRELERELLALVTRAAFDLRSDALTARTVTVKIRDMDFRNRSARRTLPEGVVSDRVVMGVARELLAKLRAGRRVPARLLGVGLSSLAADPRADQFHSSGQHAACGKPPRQNSPPEEHDRSAERSPPAREQPRLRDRQKP